MSYINRRYYESQQEAPNSIWRYLSCIEKIAYHQFQDTQYDMEDIFCDDINICILERDDELVIKRNSLKSIKQYFDVIWRTNLTNPEEYIKRQIDAGIIVGLNTYFYDIPNFLWYKGEGNKDSKHICMVVGYDEENFWFTDVPRNMISEYLVEQHLTRIPNEEMRQYLNKRCNVITFREKNNVSHIYDDLRVLIKEMLLENSILPYKDDEGIMWKGKFAYERLIYLLRMRDQRAIRMELYHGEYMATIISGRRELLRRNILKKYGNNEETKNVLLQLKNCAQMWEILGNKIEKEVLKKSAYDPKEDAIINIYDAEKKLVKSLEDFAAKIK